MADVKLSTADTLFFDRIAVKMFAEPTLTLAQAAAAVCDDDRRLGQRLLNDEGDFKTTVVNHLADKVYEAIRRTQ